MLVRGRSCHAHKVAVVVIRVDPPPSRVITQRDDTILFVVVEADEAFGVVDLDSIKPAVGIRERQAVAESIFDAVDAMKRGADDYIAKGRMQIDELEMRIARALRARTPRAWSAPTSSARP